MTPFTETISLKVLGGLIGSILSVSVLIPQTYRQAILRVLAGIMSAILLGELVSGSIFGDAAGQHLLAGSGLAGFGGWFAFGVIARTAARWDTLRDAANDIRKIKDGTND